MRHGFLGAIAALMAGTGLVWGQEPPFGPMPSGGGAPPGMEGVTPWPPPSNPEALATNNVRVPNVWFGAEYLGWYAKRARSIHPLVTTSANAQGGVVGESTTSILYQGKSGNEFFSGGRVYGGMFFASDNRFGAQFSLFLLGDGTDSFVAESQGSGVPLLARPYIDQNTGANATAVIGSPTIGPGKITVDSETQTWGASADWVLNIYRGSPQAPWAYNLNLFAGFGVVSVRDSVSIANNTDYYDNIAVPFLGQTFTAGQSISNSRRQIFGADATAIFLDITTDSDSLLRTGVVDRFRTSNQFYGGEVGFASHLRVGKWSLGLNAKLGLGVMHSSVEVQGYSTLFQLANQTIITQRVDATGIPLQTVVTQTQQVTQQTAVGGLYATGNRVGRQSHTTFAYAPEGLLNLSYQLTPTVTASLGYSFLYVSKVVRANHVMNQVVNPALVPTHPAYGAPLQTTQTTQFFPYSSYWVQGFNAGLSIQY